MQDFPPPSAPVAPTTPATTSSWHPVPPVVPGASALPVLPTPSSILGPASSVPYVPVLPPSSVDAVSGDRTPEVVEPIDPRARFARDAIQAHRQMAASEQRSTRRETHPDLGRVVVNALLGGVVPVVGVFFTFRAMFIARRALRDCRRNPYFRGRKRLMIAAYLPLLVLVAYGVAISVYFLAGPD